MPSDHGAQLRPGQTPSLYTTKSADTAYYYARARELPFDTFQNQGVWDSTLTSVNKYFQVYLGIRSNLPPPHHSGKIVRGSWAKNQFKHRVGSYEVTYVEFLCVGGEYLDQQRYLEQLTEDKKKKQQNVKQFARRRDKAHSLMWDVPAGDLQNPQRRPEVTERKKLAETPAWEMEGAPLPKQARTERPPRPEAAQASTWTPQQ